MGGVGGGGQVKHETTESSRDSDQINVMLRLSNIHTVTAHMVG